MVYKSAYSVKVSVKRRFSFFPALRTTISQQSTQPERDTRNEDLPTKNARFDRHTYNIRRQVYTWL